MRPPRDAKVEAAADTVTAASGEGIGAHVLTYQTVGTLGRGMVVGRFMVVDRIGAGGMGTVYKAYDPELDRSVALKVVHASGDREARARLLREARALAQLAHPNVIALYDVLPLAEDVCIAMEFVDGETLGAWTRAPGRTRAQILAAFAAAGQGLAAAHARGIVHRDFKPNNVLVGRDQRVRVVDFGLARGLVGPGGDDAGGAAGSPSPTSNSVTRTGAVVGTPAYMSPEQAEGAVPGPASDQYSFCVALFEALCGERPFPQVPTPRPLDAELPAWLRALLARGLRREPAERFPDMDALLEALARGQRRVRAPVLVALAGVALLAIVAGVATTRATRAAEPCQGLSEHLAGVWDAPRRAGVDRAFRATGRSYAADAAVRTTAALDDYGRRWVATRTQVCRAAKVRGDEPEARYAARVRCLDRRLLELGQLGELLRRADDAIVGHALSAVEQLTDPARCAGADALPADAPAPITPGARAAVAAAQLELAKVGAYWRAEQHQAGRPLAHALAESARTIDDPRTVAEALLLYGRLEDTAGHFEPARRAYLDAALAAERGHDDALRFEARLALMEVVGNDLNLAEELSVAADEARALWSRLGSDRVREAEWLEVLVAAEVRLGRLELAQAHATRLLELRQDEPGLGRATALLAACNVRARRAELNPALPLCEQALGLAEAALGAEHPGLARYHDTIGWILTRQGKYPEGEQRHRRALAMVEAAYGAESDAASMIYINLGNNLRQQKRFDDSLAALGQVIAIESRLGREQSAIVAGALTNYGQTLVEMVRYEDAMVYLERALATYQALPGQLNPAVSWTLSTMAVVDWNRLQQEQALARWREAAQAIEAALGPESPQLIWPLSRLVLGLMDLERWAEALPVLERAVALAERAPPDYRFHAQLELGLGETLLLSGGDRVRGLALAEKARARMIAGGSTDAQALAEYDRVLGLFREPR